MPVTAIAEASRSSEREEKRIISGEHREIWKEASGTSSRRSARREACAAGTAPGNAYGPSADFSGWRTAGGHPFGLEPRCGNSRAQKRETGKKTALAFPWTSDQYSCNGPARAAGASAARVPSSGPKPTWSLGPVFYRRHR